MKKIYMIGNSHIDPVWMWNQQEGVMEVGATVRSALERMEEFPDFIFSFSSVAFYRWLEENVPDIFKQVLRRVEEGRFELVGGMMVEPDCNIPGGEGLVRQMLYSQRYLKKTFNRLCKVGYNVDSFGHAASLPQLLKKCGMEYYVLWRPGPDRLALPAPLFRWETPDGSAVTAFRLEGEYTAWTKKGIMNNLQATLEAMAKSDQMEAACFYGVGNHGGGPTIDNIKAVKELSASEKEKGVDITFSTVEGFFENNKDAVIPSYRGEMAVIFDGCFSADSELKKLCRQSESALVTSEKLNAMLALMGRGINRTGDFESAWWQVGFNHFHDVMAGTSLFEGRNEAVEDFHGALSIARRIDHQSMQAICAGIDTRGDGFPLVLFNPHGFAFEGEVEADVYWRHSKGLRLKNDEGQDVYYQELNSPFESIRRQIVFNAKVPAMGYAVYRLLEENLLLTPDKDPVLKCIETADAITIENAFLSATIDKQSAMLTSLCDKTTGYQSLAGAVQVKVYEDNRDTWGSEGKAWDFVENFSPVSLGITECGCNRIVITAKLQSSHAKLTQRYLLDKSSDLLKLENDLTSYEKWKLIKWATPLSLAKIKTLSEMPYGLLERSHEKNQEYFHHGFVDCMEEEGKGLAIVNDGKFGYRIHEGSYELTLSRSPIYAFATGAKVRENTHYEFSDQGRQCFALALCPHGDKMAPHHMKKYSECLEKPIRSLMECRHEGAYIQRACSLVTVHCPQVFITAMKCKEGAPDTVVLRLFEVDGNACDCLLTLKGQDYTLHFEANELKTLCFLDGVLTETDCLEGLS